MESRANKFNKLLMSSFIIYVRNGHSDYFLRVPKNPSVDSDTNQNVSSQYTLRILRHEPYRVSVSVRQFPGTIAYVCETVPRILTTAWYYVSVKEYMRFLTLISHTHAHTVRIEYPMIQNMQRHSNFVLYFNHFQPSDDCTYIACCNIEQDRQCTYNVTLRRVHETTVVVEKQ
jgi:hypothetical protein